MSGYDEHRAKLATLLTRYENFKVLLDNEARDDIQKKIAEAEQKGDHFFKCREQLTDLDREITEEIDSKQKELEEIARLEKTLANKKGGFCHVDEYKKKINSSSNSDQIDKMKQEVKAGRLAQIEQYQSMIDEQKKGVDDLERLNKFHINKALSTRIETVDELRERVTSHSGLMDEVISLLNKHRGMKSYLGDSESYYNLGASLTYANKVKETALKTCAILTKLSADMNALKSDPQNQTSIRVEFRYIYTDSAQSFHNWMQQSEETMRKRELCNKILQTLVESKDVCAKEVADTAPLELKSLNSFPSILPQKLDEDDCLLKAARSDFEKNPKQLDALSDSPTLSRQNTITTDHDSQPVCDTDKVVAGNADRVRDDIAAPIQTGWFAGFFKWLCCCESGNAPTTGNEELQMVISQNTPGLGYQPHALG